MVFRKSHEADKHLTELTKKKKREGTNTQISNKSAVKPREPIEIKSLLKEYSEQLYAHKSNDLCEVVKFLE